MASILIVDDSGFLRGRIRNILQQAGHESAEAPEGIEALEKIQTGEFDCVLLDLIMPRADGFKVLKRLRETDDPTPVVVLTSDCHGVARERCLMLGARSFLPKRARPKELLEAIDEAIGVKAGQG